jgi:hypothetical protein
MLYQKILDKKEFSYNFNFHTLPIKFYKTLINKAKF